MEGIEKHINTTCFRYNITSCSNILIMVASRGKLTGIFENSVFYHVLETEGITAVEEVHDRNFRDMMFPLIAANVYVHVMFYTCVHISHPERFLVSQDIWYLPESGNQEEERMLGVYPQHFYFVSKDINQLEMHELLDGRHLLRNHVYLKWKRSPYTDEEKFFIDFAKTLQRK